MRELNFLKQKDYADFVCSPDAAGHCITCSDDAQAVEVLRVDQAAGTALVRLEGGQEAASEVDISLLEEVAPGDTLLVHGGVALSNQTQTGPADRS